MKRRQFFKTTGSAGLLATTGLIHKSPLLLMDLYAFNGKANLSKVEARYYKKHPDREIECVLCPRFCKLGDKERGYCGVRENMGGTYYTLVYGKACTANIDPIEKKPLFHFFPKSDALSIATAGCNVNCKFCQNWEISQVRPEQIQHFDFPPSSVVEFAQKHKSPIIAYTYSEPVIFYEYMYDTSIEARKKSIKSVVITGGHINPEPMEELTKVVDAIKIDLKAFSQDFYTTYVQGELQPVLEAIKIVHNKQIWLEIVYLVIPTLNDSPKEIRSLAQWIMKEIGPDVPLHFSRFHPTYLVKNLPQTPESILERARKVALEEGLHYVYIGNIWGHKAESTFCPKCKNNVIPRRGFEVGKIELNQGRCKFCNTLIPGIWT
ncbi:MAG: AmmeMemoRadiSam system radical SAM enzyme [Candidatus Aminicenantes bacterium]|nr:MAG: AmmeMemoRadiSam system radical SAM enzyme [Candidatus Aminicenantes bacterium]